MLKPRSEIAALAESARASLAEADRAAEERRLGAERAEAQALEELREAVYGSICRAAYEGAVEVAVAEIGQLEIALKEAGFKTLPVRRDEPRERFLTKVLAEADAERVRLCTSLVVATQSLQVRVDSGKSLCAWLDTFGRKGALAEPITVGALIAELEFRQLAKSRELHQAPALLREVVAAHNRYSEAAEKLRNTERFNRALPPTLEAGTLVSWAEADTWSGQDSARTAARMLWVSKQHEAAESFLSCHLEAEAKYGESTLRIDFERYSSSWYAVVKSAHWEDEGGWVDPFTAAEIATHSGYEVEARHLEHDIVGEAPTEMVDLTKITNAGRRPISLVFRWGATS